jgi:hypothetical protein
MPSYVERESSDALSASSLDLMVRFLTWLYDRQAGYAEVVAGTPKPDAPSKIDLMMGTRHWMYYDPERPDLTLKMAAIIAALAGTWGNVYVGVRLYDKRAKTENMRREDFTLPSHIIFVDDAPANTLLPYSASIRTSEGSRHAYYKCDQPVTKEDARRAAAALDGDPSGSDLTQLVRVPGTYNTKNHGAFLIHVETGKPRTYSLRELREAWDRLGVPAEAGSKTCRDGLPAEAPPATIDWAEVEKYLAQIKRLLDCDGIPRRLSQKSQARLVLAGKLSPRSTSDARAWVCKGLVLHGYPDAEIAALLLHCCDDGVSAKKGLTWLYADIARLIAKYRAERPDIRPTPTRALRDISLSTQPVVSQAQRKSRARKDRPSKLSADQLLAWYRTEAGPCGRLIGRRKDTAVELGISIPTLDRLDRELRTRGAITIETPAPRTYRVVVIADQAPAPQACTEPAGAINRSETASATRDEAASEVVVAGDEHAQAVGEPSGGAIIITGDGVLSAGVVQPIQTQNAVPASTLGEHTAPTAPAEASGLDVADTGTMLATAAHADVELDVPAQLERPLTLTELVREAFDAYAGTRMTVKRIAAYIAMNGSGRAWPTLAIQRAIAAERKRRAALPWEIERQAVRAMSDAELLSAVKARQRTLTRYAGAPREGYYRARLAIADDERRRRDLSMPVPRQRRACLAGVGAVCSSGSGASAFEQMHLLTELFNVVQQQAGS